MPLLLAFPSGSGYQRCPTRPQTPRWPLSPLFCELWVESRTGALTVGSGGYSVAFASGLSPAPLSRFQSPLSEPDVRFSRISALQWDHASRTQVPARIRGRLPWVWHPSPTPIHVRSRSAARPVDALTTPSSSDDPFTFACDASGVSGPFTGVSGFRHSRDPSPFGHRSHLRLLPSTGITRLLQYYEPLATLSAQPPPHGVPVRCVPHHPQGFPCCCLLPLPCVPASLPRRVQRGARVARFPLRLRPSPFLRWVGPRIARFEACSTFTRVPARMFAEPPYAALCHQGASDHIVASMIRPGCYQPERQLLDGFRTR